MLDKIKKNSNLTILQSILFALFALAFLLLDYPFETIVIILGISQVLLEIDGIKKQFKRDKSNEDTHYFISWEGYANGNVIYNDILIPFSDKNEIELKCDIKNYVLNEARKYNNNVEKIHIIAFNKV